MKSSMKRELLVAAAACGQRRAVGAASRRESA